MTVRWRCFRLTSMRALGSPVASTVIAEQSIARRRSGRVVAALLGVLGLMAAVLAAAAAPAQADTSAIASGPLQLSASTPGPVLSGMATTYTVTVTNTTTVPAWGIQIGGQLPAGMTLNTLLNPDVCARSNKQILPGTAFNCGGGDLAPGASTSIAFTATAAQPSLYTIALSATGSVGGTWSGFVLIGSVFTTNNVSLPVQVSPGPTDIQVTGSASTGSPTLGSMFSYTFQVKNNGSQGAYGVTFDDTLPPSLTLAGVATTGTGTCGAVALNAVHCNLGDFIVGGQTNVVVTAVAPTVSGSITDTASISMLGPDTHPANNSVSVTVQPK